MTTPIFRIEHNFLWHFYAKKGEKPQWHFMGSVYHRENMTLLRVEHFDFVERSRG